jgi:hypothetical protein
MRFINIRKKYQNSQRAIADVAKKKGIPVEAVALQAVKEKLPAVRKYVTAAGLIADENPVNLSIQAAIAHENKIKHKMESQGITDYFVAENAVFNDEADNFDGDDEVENFAPALLAVVGTVAGKGIEGINQKREQRGKQPILSGKFWQNLKSKFGNVRAQVGEDEVRLRLQANPNVRQTGEQTELGAGIIAARGELERQAKKDYLRRNLPVVLIVSALVIVAVIYFAKKK